MPFKSRLGSAEKCSGIGINGFSAGGCEGEGDLEFRVAFLRYMKKANPQSQVEGVQSSLIVQTG